MNGWECVCDKGELGDEEEDEWMVWDVLFGFKLEFELDPVVDVVTCDEEDDDDGGRAVASREEEEKSSLIALEGVLFDIREKEGDKEENREYCSVI